MAKRSATEWTAIIAHLAIIRPIVPSLLPVTPCGIAPGHVLAPQAGIGKARCEVSAVITKTRARDGSQ